VSQLPQTHDRTRDFKEHYSARRRPVSFIAAEKRDGLWEAEKFLRQNPLSYPFLLDEDRMVVKAYGLYHRVGIDAWNVSHPATLVLDRTTRVRYIHKGTSQGDRAPMEDVMKALRKVSAGSAGASAGT
jgi:peroxiredoxin